MKASIKASIKNVFNAPEVHRLVEASGVL